MSAERWLLGAALFGFGLAACSEATGVLGLAALFGQADENEHLAAPRCASFDYDAGEPIALKGVSQGFGQSIPAGVTPSAATILVQHGGCSAGLSLAIADEIPSGSGFYQTFAVPPLPSMDTSFEENVTIAPDGLSIVGLNARDDGFLETTRTAVGAVDFDIPSAGDFAQIEAKGPQRLWAPVLSPDRLAFYYSVKHDPSADVNGIYESLRSSTLVPFAPGTRMSPAIQSEAQYVNAVSGDRLTIFLESTYVYRAVVFTRASVDDEFKNPNAPNAPPVAPGLRAKPIAGCRGTIATCAPAGGGCASERVCMWSR